MRFFLKSIQKKWLILDFWWKKINESYENAEVVGLTEWENLEIWWVNAIEVFHNLFQVMWDIAILSEPHPEIILSKTVSRSHPNSFYSCIR